MIAVRSAERLAVAMLPLLLLAACGGAMPPQAAKPAGRVPAAPGQEPVGELTAAAAVPVPDPMGLKGQTPVQLRATLGTPVFMRRDAPAEIWQYRGRDCTLDLFLYDGSGGQTVEHYAVRSPGALPAKDCLDELEQRDRASPKS